MARMALGPNCFSSNFSTATVRGTEIIDDRDQILRVGLGGFGASGLSTVEIGIIPFFGRVEPWLPFSKLQHSHFQFMFGLVFTLSFLLWLVPFLGRPLFLCRDGQTKTTSTSATWRDGARGNGQARPQHTLI